MLSFFIGLITLISLFALCLVISYAFYSVTTTTPKEKPAKKETKVYYVTNFQTKESQPKPRPKVQPDIALKGITLNKDELQKYFVDSSGNFVKK